MDTAKYEFRTLFISDLHLGSLACNADLLLAFLRRMSYETLVVIGDAFDYECTHSMRHWTVQCDHVLAEMIAISRHGVHVLYLPGNHDDFAKCYAGGEIFGAEIHRSRVYELMNGQRALLVHGDEQDSFPTLDESPLTRSISHLYERVCRVSRWTTDVLRFFGIRPVGFAHWFRRRHHTFWKALYAFEAALVAEAKRLQCQAVICGHMHAPDIKTVDGILYANSGDWLESCSAIVETYDGTLRLLRVAKA